jgi:hypothetical protein
MRVLFAGGNTSGANSRIAKLIQNTENEYKIAGYFKNHHHLETIDWTLDALFAKKIKKEDVIEEFGADVAKDHELFLWLLNDIIEWKPDLVINDCEDVTAKIAHKLQIPMWYCSPLLLSTCTKWKDKATTKIAKRIRNLPRADRYLVYSPFVLFADDEHDCEFFDIEHGRVERIRHKLATTLPEHVVLSKSDTCSVAACIAESKTFYW